MTERSFTQVYVAVGALIEQDERFLLVQEAVGKDTGKWNQPAGWLEVGEDPLVGIVREVREETGYTFTPQKFLGVYSRIKEDERNSNEGLAHGIKLVYIGTVSGVQEEITDEIVEARWFSLTEIKELASKKLLRNSDILPAIEDYQAGIAYPLTAVRHLAL